MQVAVSRTADDEYRAKNHDGIIYKINNNCGINIYIIIKIFIVMCRKCLIFSLLACYNDVFDIIFLHTKLQHFEKSLYRRYGLVSVVSA